MARRHLGKWPESEQRTAAWNSAPQSGRKWYEILGADVRLRFSDARRMVRPSGTEAPGAQRCGHTMSCAVSADP